MQVSNSPLIIDDRVAVTQTKVKRGTIRERILTIKYIGDQDEASVNFWLEPNDSKSEVLLNCYTFKPLPLVKVKRGDTVTVAISFEIPPQVLPDFYNYSVVFESAQHPGATVRRSQQLQVIPSDEDSSMEMEPGFTVTPITTSTKPYLLTAETTLAIKVNVENRSKLVDRFYLTCPELDKSWFTVQYPEGAIESLGIVKETDGLPLYSKSQGEITLLLHPPRYTWAGSYFPTLQLTSRNNEDLILLDVLYLQVLPDDRLQTDLAPPLRQIPQDPSQFDFQLTNLGNIKRNVTIRAGDRDQTFVYTPAPCVVELDPGSVANINLNVKPRHRWKRPLRGKGTEIPFAIELEDTHDPFPKASAFIAESPNIAQGTILWKARPWWLLWLLILLPLLGIAGIALLFWLTRPKLPEILSFAVTPPIKQDKPDEKASAYQEGKTEPVRLDWEVDNWQQIDRIVIVRLEKGVETYRKNFSVQDWRKYWQEHGEFESYLNRRNSDGTQKDKNFCEVSESKSTKAGSQPRLETFNFLGLPLPDPTSANQPQPSSKLTCKGIITETKKAGDYTFQMQVFRIPKDAKSPEKDPIATQTTDTIAVKPDDEPQIISFAPTQAIYQELSASTPSPLSNLIAPPIQPPTPSTPPTPLTPASIATTIPTPTPIASTAPTPIAPSALAPTQPTNAPGLVRLNWKISNPSRIEEIRLVALSPDGSIQGEPKIYSITELNNLCLLKTDELICTNLPTTVRKPGDYIFKLTAIIKQERGNTELTRSTEPIKIQPSPLEIKTFTVNGKTAAEKPKHVFLLSQSGDSFDIALSWDVSGGEDIKVELMPSPGVVKPRDSTTFSITAPSSETITLKVSNKFGEQKTQSVVVQAIAPQDTPAPIIISPLPPPGSANPNNSGNSAPAPSTSNELAPIEVPPRPN